MPEYVTRMTSSSFVMRLPVDEKNAIEVTVCGKGLKYDRDSGVLVSGDVDSIALTDLTLVGRRFSPVETRKLGGLDIPAEKIADFAGEKFWNHIKVVIELFDKYAQIHDGISFSYMSPTKNVMQGSDLNDILLGTKNADVLDGNKGDDRLFGGNGDDSMNGQAGNDLLSGGSGSDFMVDTSGSNKFSGGLGNDRMHGGVGADKITGAAGRDILYGAGGIDNMSGGRDSDVFVFNTKQDTRITITDFDRSDVLVDVSGGGAEQTYKEFLNTARQVGKDVVYDVDGVHLLLKKVDIDSLGAHNFGDVDIVMDAGLLF